MIKTKCLACGVEDIALLGNREAFSTCPKCDAKAMNKDWKLNYENAHCDLTNPKYYYYECPKCHNKKRLTERPDSVPWCSNHDCVYMMQELTDPIRKIKTDTSSLRGQFIEQHMREYQEKINAMTPFDFYFERRFRDEAFGDVMKALLEGAFDAGRNHEEYG